MKRGPGVQAIRSYVTFGTCTLLNLMEQRMKVVRGMVALCDKKSGEIFFIRASA